MGQATSQVEAHIEDNRAELGSNPLDLEQKVKAVTEWKQHFKRNPTAMLGVAFGGGILLATMMGGRKRRGARALLGQAGGEPAPHRGTVRQKNRTLETWDNVKGALIGVAARRFKDLVSEVVAGFHEQYRTTEEKGKRHFS
jgi:hypothetical protein